MATSTAPFTIHFPEWFSERVEYEMEAKGFLQEVTVELEDGKRFQLYIYDPVRLAQDLTAYVGCGQHYVAEPNLVVIPRVTVLAIQSAVAEMIRDRVFDDLKPLGPESAT
jgi:hypothetical protein